ncbi:MAG: nitroreductase family protein [Bacteroidota bacterium]
MLELVQKRRSIRSYLRKTIETEKVQLLIEVALRAPSSRGLNPWEFILVDQGELLEKLSNSKEHGSSFLKNAPLGIVICADPARCDVWIEDASIAGTYLQLAAESIGLGSCWIQIRERKHSRFKTAEEYVREVLNIPDHLKVEAIIALGYPAEKLPPHSEAELDRKKIHCNLY